ncbi:MAG: hypothetical protein V3T08_09830 [Gemmatimonadota bacterium]
MTDAECGPLHVLTDGVTCKSLWWPSLVERLSILFFGRVWVYVRSGTTQPAIAIRGRRPNV